jgi:hypothetical protein
MKRLFGILIVCLAALIGACATSPENIQPLYVSDMAYQNLDCNQLGQEQARLVSALSAAEDRQRECRSNDTVGVILLGLPVSSLSGSNMASEVGRLKGELQAVQKQATIKECQLPIYPLDLPSKKEEPKPTRTRMQWESYR